MIKTLQTVGWSLLNPAPLTLSGPVVCLTGENGSGKTSTLDSCKALLSARRFGPDRTVHHYRFAGRAGAPAARAAYVLGVFSNELGEGGRRLPEFGDEFTVVLEVGAHQRRFLALPGAFTLPVEETEQAISALFEEHPRKEWMTPEEYSRKILEPLGVGPALRRLLELPQGEIQRALDRDPRELAGVLVELSGGKEALERFQSAQLAVREARDSHAEAQRRLDRRGRELAEARLQAAEATRVEALRSQLSELAGAASELLDASPAEQQSLGRQQRLPIAAQKPGVINQGRLRQAGVVLHRVDGVLAVLPADREKAVELLGPGEALPVAGEGLAFLVSRGALIVGLGEVEAEPAGQGPEDEEEEEIVPPAALSQADRRSLERLLSELAEAGVEPGRAAEGQWQPQALVGAVRALCPHGVPVIPDSEPLERLVEIEKLLEADQSELDYRRQQLSEAEDRLADARAVYDRAVMETLSRAAERFSVLCHDAGLVGRLELGEDAGQPTVALWAAEEEGEIMRPLHGAQASLSGGWRASIVVLALLSCLESERAVSILCLDEVGASLDETRLVALGRAFARLGETRGLQTIITLPTRVQSEMVAEFAAQQIGFFRVEPDEPVGPPPHIVTAPARQMQAA